MLFFKLTSIENTPYTPKEGSSSRIFLQMIAMVELQNVIFGNFSNFNIT